MQPQTCDATGAFQNTGMPCPAVCSAASGSCGGVCTPGAKTCNGAQPQTCDALGAWQNTGTACGACSMCSMATGACVGTTGGTCNDNNACTTGDTCQAGTCTGGMAVTCATPDQCHTQGACNPASGCPAPANKTGACNDGNACTTGESCSAGVCGGGSVVTCATPDQCHTQGACVPATGCPAPANRTGSCSTGNLCITGQTCSNGTCGGGTTKTCTASACMQVGACVTSTGNCPAMTPAPNGTSCTGGTCLQGSCCIPNNSACNGKTCGTVVNNCNQVVSCAPNSCPAYTSCTQATNLCNCQAGRSLGCSTPTAPTCGFWSFENGLEGWSLQTGSDAVTGPITNSTTFHSHGARSLAVPFNGSIGNFLEVGLSICATDVAGATLTAHLHFSPPPPNLFVRFVVAGIPIVGAIELSSDDVVLTQVVPSPWASPGLVVIHVDDVESTEWVGTVFIDEVKIQ
ncbi:MAG: hypothetical protein ABUS79_05125 [Pseudomonadota bacterium]